jgi:hypothetical protein
MKERKNLSISNFDQELADEMRRYLANNGVSIRFFVEKAIREKLKRDTKKDEK